MSTRHKAHAPDTLSAMSETPIPIVTTTFEGDVATISIDDGKANALSFVLIEQVHAALRDAAAESKACVLLGREGRFCAGFDLSIMTSGAHEARRLLEAGAELALQIFTSPIPIVLGVTGHALAMGAILTTTADYRVGAEGPYKIGLNEVAIGMPVPAFAVGLCRDRLSKRWFNRCLQTAEICNPEQAVDAGFLDEVVAADQVATRAAEVAAHLAAYVHPGPFEVTRRNLRGHLAEELGHGLRADLRVFNVEA